MCVCVCVNVYIIKSQKLAQHCKSTALQFKKIVQICEGIK